MDENTARANIRELVDLLEDAQAREFRKYGMVYHGRTMGEVAKFHENAGLLRVFDFALPQAWFDAYIAWARSPGVVYSGEVQHDRPVGVVWCYDAPGYSGAPYALTAGAQLALDAFERAGGYRRWARPEVDRG